MGKQSVAEIHIRPSEVDLVIGHSLKLQSPVEGFDHPVEFIGSSSIHGRDFVQIFSYLGDVRFEHCCAREGILEAGVCQFLLDWAVPPLPGKMTPLHCSHRH